MSRTLLATAALAMLAAGCLHEPPSTPLRGEIRRHGAGFVVAECSTGRVYELRLVPAAHVALERRVDEIAREQGEPVLVELGGKTLPATPATAADALFDVHERYSVRHGACP
jgi:hypothetical protein